MKLFHFTTVNLATTTGGCKSHVEGIARGMHNLGWEVTLFSACDGGEPQPGFPFEHVLVRRARRSLVRYALEQALLLARLARRRGPRPHAVYVRHNPTLVAPYLYARWLRIPYFVEVNTLPEFQGSRAHLLHHKVAVENWILRHARGIFPVTPELKAYLTRRAGLPPEKFRVIPNGCAAEHCRASAGLEALPPEGDHTIGFLGSFEPWQGVETVLRAIPFLRRDFPDATLLVAGEGRLASDYTRLVDELGVADAVRFPGCVAPRDVPAFLSKCAVVVCPRIKAFGENTMARFVGTSPLKLFTYLGCGRVVVASDLPSLDLFRQTPAVRFAKPDDPADFARALGGVLRMPAQERARLGRQGREFVLDGYTWDQLARKTADAILRWCGAGSQRPSVACDAISHSVQSYRCPEKERP